MLFFAVCVLVDTMFSVVWGMICVVVWVWLGDLVLGLFDFLVLGCCVCVVLGFGLVVFRFRWRMFLCVRQVLVGLLLVVCFAVV